MIIINLLLLIQDPNTPFERRLDSDPDSFTWRAEEQFIDGIPNMLLYIICSFAVAFVWLAITGKFNK